MPPLPIAAIFADLPDPRRETANKLHHLTDILAIATCAVIGGAETWEAIAEYGRTKEAFFRRFLPLDNGIPSPDTFERVFAKLDPAAFAAASGRWLAPACGAAAPRRFLPLDNGIPSPDSFERVFAKLDPAAFAAAFGRWMAAACEATGLI